MYHIIGRYRRIRQTSWLHFRNVLRLNIDIMLVYMKYTHSSFFGNFTVTVTIILPFRLFIIFIGVTISYFTRKKNMSSIHNQKMVSKNFSVIKIICAKQNKFNDLTTLRWPKPWHGPSQYDDQWVDLLIKVCSQRANHRGRVESRDRSDIFVKKVILSSVRGVWAIVIPRLTTPWKDTSSWGTWSWISRSWRRGGVWCRDYLKSVTFWEFSCKIPDFRDHDVGDDNP